MTDLRGNVARAIDPAIWSWEPDANNTAQMEGHSARKRLSLADADAAIAAVLEALKEPSEAMTEAGEDVITYPADDFIRNRADIVWSAMLTAFKRDHYLSALAGEDGREV